LIFLIYFIVLFIILACWVILFTPVKDIQLEIIFIPTLISFILSIITLSVLVFNTKYEIVYDGYWKQIYSNNIKADIDISLKDGTIFKTYKPGEKFGDKKIWGDFKLNYDGFVKAYKDNVSEEKKIYLSKSNIEIEDKINENSIISKVEYRKLKGKKIKLFNIEEELGSSNYDGELKIKISQLNNESKKDLENLFEPEK
jgi:hypothetical protein